VGPARQRKERGELIAGVGRKISTRKGQLLVDLKPTRKIIGELRDWFSQAVLVGWKYGLDSDRAGAVQAAERQIAQNRTNACVVNGTAYGDGFGLVKAAGQCGHLTDARALYRAL